MDRELPFLSERMKNKKINKLVCNLHDKKAYKSSKASVESWNDFKIQFNQEAWLKPHTDMNTKLRTEAKKRF